ncbi:MAG: hypothetical protein HZB91_08310 [Elusimicrobia bacterium]|nr:hypothetical protein [Elusimicrobiota bacterium]
MSIRAGLPSSKTGILGPLLCLGALLAPSSCPAIDSWNESVAPHFVIKHESPWMPPGFTLSLEKIHSRLRMDLSMFSPWMAKERLTLYLYKGRDSYVKGEFQPPEWSNGLAMYDRKAVIVYDQKEDRKKLLEVIGHETTHLLFEGYWSEVNKQPPTWLNEGLAMMEEGAYATQPEKSDWYQTMAYWDHKTFMSLPGFLETAPTVDMKDKGKDDKSVAGWYVQAYSLVFFLHRGHQSPMQFKIFCAKLRDGSPLEDALWTGYRYKTLDKLEKSWRAWLADPKHQRKVERVSASATAPGGLATPIEAKGFDSFRR